MKKKTKNIGVILVTVLLLLGVSLLGASWYLLDYALKPIDRGRQMEQAWVQMDSLYPGLKVWHDSLDAAGLSRDTLIQAADGATLHARYIRQGQPTRRTAVLVHGYTDCWVRMLQLGRMYHHDLGANLILPDLRNAGQTDGDHFQMGWKDRLDVKRWITLVPELFGDSATVVVHGVSMGGATTMMLSGDADVPDCVRAYVDDCGYTSVDDQFTKELKEQYGLPRFPLIPAASALCELRYGWNFAEASALEQVKKATRPMLFIHGAEDGYVPTWMVYPLYEAHPGTKSLWVVPEAVHARSYKTHPAEYTRRVRQFLEEQTTW